MPVVTFVTVIIMSAIVRTPAPGISVKVETATVRGSKALARLNRDAKHSICLIRRQLMSVKKRHVS